MRDVIVEDAQITLVVFCRSGIWRVMINDQFYGDYVRKDWALQSALDRAHELRSSGRRAQVKLTDHRTNSVSVIDESP
ncbi:MAG: hypothetical protein KF779_08545 [Hyphomonadaceae bacterium]|nr:hypothetical protein [Hyphomonadaceae bacterium]